MEKNNLSCTSVSCTWTKTEEENNPPICVGSVITDCSAFNLLEANSSVFHDQDLIEATQKIKQIVDDIPEHPKGYKLSLLITEMGLLLSWVNHGEEISAEEKTVTSKDSPEVVAQALGLKNWKSAKE